MHKKVKYLKDYIIRDSMKKNGDDKSWMRSIWREP
jgi:hypothetical protein